MAYATGSETVDQLLDNVSTAQADPTDVFPKLREAISTLPGGADAAADAVYGALRNAVWTFIASGEKGPHLNRWADLILRVRQYLRIQKSSVAERLTTLADLMEKSVNAAEQTDKAKLGKHHLAILNCLARDGEVARAKLLRETGLKDSNLSHVISRLAASRLIDRIPVGREASIQITDAGRRLLEARGNQQSRDLVQSSAFGWEHPDCGLAVADSNKGLVRCNAAFASLLSTTPEQLISLPVATFRETLEARIQYPDQPTTGEVNDGNGRARHVVEFSEGERTHWLAFDVTAYRRKINELQKRERTLAKQLENLQAKASASDDMISAVYRDRSKAAAQAVAGMWQHMKQDVMTPVTSIAATARLLAKDQHLGGSERKDYLSAIIDQSDHLKKVMGGMIAVADADPSIFTPEPFCPADVAREIADNFANSAKQHGYTIAADPIGESQVVADLYAFKAVLQNAVAEVVDTVSSGAKVGIHTETDAQGVKVRLEAMGSDASGQRYWKPDVLARCEALVSGFGAKMDYTGLANGSLQYYWPIKDRTG
jgi:signal transduction histidine kinase